MNFYRLKSAMKMPLGILHAKLDPVGYARSIGVKMVGKVTIYGSSHKMFSSEPYLVTLHDNVFISVGAQFICHDGGVLPFRKDHPTLDLAGPITVKSNCFIGAGALILQGVTIGQDCIVAAGALVTKDVPDGMIVGGNPARVIKSTQEYLTSAKERSLGIGDIVGETKHKKYKKIFGIDRT